MEALAKYGDMALPPALRSIVAERPCASPAGGPRLLDRVLRGDPHAPPEPPNRGGVRLLDPPLHLLPRQAASGGAGCARGHPVPVQPRRRRTGERLHSEPGAVRAPLPVSAGPERRPAVARRPRASQAPGAPAGRPRPQGSALPTLLPCR